INACANCGVHGAKPMPGRRKEHAGDYRAALCGELGDVSCNVLVALLRLRAEIASLSHKYSPGGNITALCAATVAPVLLLVWFAPGLGGAACGGKMIPRAVEERGGQEPMVAPGTIEASLGFRPKGYSPGEPRGDGQALQVLQVE